MSMSMTVEVCFGSAEHGEVFARLTDVIE